MTKFNVGQVVGQRDDYDRLRRGVVTKVTATGRVTVKMQKPNGHEFMVCFDSTGRVYPKQTIYSDGPLTTWTLTLDRQWEKDVAVENTKKKMEDQRKAAEEAEVNLDRDAMQFTLLLLKKRGEPAARRAITVINRFGYGA